VSSTSSYDTKEQVRQAIDIVDLVGSYIQLRREGRGYKGICPWHDDSRPSLQVNPERQSWKCWVCVIGGDIFSFVMKSEGVEFPEALSILADRAGIALRRSSSEGQKQAEVRSTEKRDLFKVAAWAEGVYHDCLLHSPEGKPALDYLKERGLSDESIRDFHLGYAPNRRDWLATQARQTPFTQQMLEQVDLITRSESGGGYYERFRDRVLFPIRDVQGRPVGMGGRLLPNSPSKSPAKYINSRETMLFSKSRLLYGMDIARDPITRSHTVLVTEGYTDTILAHQFGFKNAVAVLGTALGEQHIQLLRRFADRIVLVLDGDTAGMRRAGEVLELFVAAQVDLRIATLPAGMDPCDLLLSGGKPALDECIEQAPDALEHRFRTATVGLHGDSDTHAINQAIEDVLATLARSPRLQADAGSRAKLREDQILHRLSRQFGVSEDRLRARRSALRRGIKSRTRSVESIEGGEVFQLTEADPWTRELVEALLQLPESVAEVRDWLDLESLSDGPLRRVLEMSFALLDAGETPTFERLLIEAEDPALKNLLVQLDTEGQAKGTKHLPWQLEQLREGDRRKRTERARRGVASNRSTAQSDHDTDVLAQIIEQERRRQSISEPTDG